MVARDNGQGVVTLRDRLNWQPPEPPDTPDDNGGDGPQWAKPGQYALFLASSVVAGVVLTYVFAVACEVLNMGWRILTGTL